MDETGQNVQVFEEVLFFKLRTTYKQKYKQLIQHILRQSLVCFWIFFLHNAGSQLFIFFFFFLTNE